MASRWYRSKRNQVAISVIFLVSLVYYAFLSHTLDFRIRDLDITRRSSIQQYVEGNLADALKRDVGSGCEMPNMDPFDPEVTQFMKKRDKIKCNSFDWVRCHLSQCRVRPEILDHVSNVACTYRDIVHVSDDKYHVGAPRRVNGSAEYELKISDHVKVTCTGKNRNNILPERWSGHAIGFRSTIERFKSTIEREDTLNVLIFGFDSTSKHGFIRKLPKSYKKLKEMGAVILNGYNIVGDGTPAALFPILTGQTELELPDVRKSVTRTAGLDDFPFLFKRLKKDGYRTLYFEDMPWIGTFQYRFNGFKQQPADHYLRSFFQEATKCGRLFTGGNQRYCTGDTPTYSLLMNKTKEFFELDGKKFAFTFVADITHDDFDLLGSADDETVNLLEWVRDSGVLQNTLLLMFSDHGPRFLKARDTYIGKLEERLPIMAILLPDRLKQDSNIYASLLHNAEVLTTPHDVYATLLDALQMKGDWSTYKVPGAILNRGLTLFQPIPKSRSCSEAAVEAHWCACLRWQNVSRTDEIYSRAANALVDYINTLTDNYRDKCAKRTLTSVQYVMRHRANKELLTFKTAKDSDGYVGKFDAKTQISGEDLSVKLTVGPGAGTYEATLIYRSKTDKFEVDWRAVQRTNAYGHEPDCISAIDPKLNPFCYCNDYQQTQGE